MPPRCQLLSGSLPLASRIGQNPQRAHRAFTTSAPLLKRKGGDLGYHLPSSIIPKDAIIPPYPYGPNLLYKQSNKGLYGGQRIQFGNNVSKETKTKTRRHWKPNVITKSLYSVALKKRIMLRLTSKVLKTMDREGGLDEYLLKESESRIKELGEFGWRLRWRLMQAPEVIARFRAEATALGLPQEDIDKHWPTKEMRLKQLRQQRQEEGSEEQSMLDQEKPKRLSEIHQTLRYNKKRAIQNVAPLYRKVVPTTANHSLTPNHKLMEQMALDELNQARLLVKATGSKREVKEFLKSVPHIAQKAKEEGTSIGELRVKWMIDRRARAIVEERRKQAEEA